MKFLRTTLSILALGLMAFSSASAQQPVAPPPKPAYSEPSLAVTMKFIQDKLNEQGDVTFVLHNLNVSQGDSAIQYGHESSWIARDCFG